MELISMTDFVLEQSKIGIEPQSISYQNQNRANRFEKIRDYANFLKQPLKLGMFIPCDENDVPLDEPLLEHYTDCNEEQNANDWLYNLEKYQQAKERVLFDGFELVEISKNLRIVKNQNKDCQVFANQVKNIYYKCVGFETIEDLVKYNLKLTNSAIKQLNL